MYRAFVSPLDGHEKEYRLMYTYQNVIVFSAANTVKRHVGYKAQ